MNDPFCLSLSDPRSTDSSLAGSKAAAITRLIQIRLPVIDGFVVTKSTFGVKAIRIYQSLARPDASRSTSVNTLCDASEYKIPCVIQAREAKKIIQYGKRISVDGDAGTV